MKKFALMFVLALIGASLMAQQLQLGAVLQLDQDRIEVAPGISFAMAAYTNEPPVAGMDSTDLVGLFTTSLGQYPIIYRGIWLKVIVYPGGFKDLKGVDYDPTGSQKTDEKSGWEALTPEEGGGYSLCYEASRLGALPLRFRIRHRDGRDRFSLLIFTATWTKAGTLPSALEIMTQREPDVRLQGESALPYLRGFLPATATRSDGGATQQRVEVPAQTVTQTATAPQVSSGDTYQPNEEVEYNSTRVSVWQSRIPKADLADDAGLTPTGEELAQKAIKYGQQGATISNIEVDSSKWTSIEVVIEDSSFFRGELLVRDLTVPLCVKEMRSGYYRTVLYGNVHSMRGAILNIIDSAGRLRSITFTDLAERREGGSR